MPRTRCRLHGSRTMCLALRLACAALPAYAAPALAVDVGGTVAATSDYVWRGTTQTSGGAAAQLGIRATAGSGWYASAWMSNVRFTPDGGARVELDTTLGWSKALDDDWSVDLNVVRYHYPGPTHAPEWNEAGGTLAYRDSGWISVGHSTRALGYQARGTYLQVGGRRPLGPRMRFEATLGHYRLADTLLGRNGYTHGALAAVWSAKGPIEARLTIHDTDRNARAIFGSAHAGRRLEASVQATF